MISFIGFYFLKAYSNKLNLISIPNERSLHTGIIPQGGGIIIGIIFLIFCFYEYHINNLKQDYFVAIFLGGGLMCITGFLDDMFDIKPTIRLFIQIFGSSLGLYFVGGVKLLQTGSDFSAFFIFSNFATVFLMVWFINVFNFMDGIDGMATSGAIFFSAFIGLFLNSIEVESMSYLLLVVSFSSLAFLFFNWTPAKMF